MKTRIALSCRWLVASLVIAPIGWGLAGGLAAVVDAQSITDAIVMFALSALWGPLYAIVVVAMFAPRPKRRPPSMQMEPMRASHVDARLILLPFGGLHDGEEIWGWAEKEC